MPAEPASTRNSERPFSVVIASGARLWLSSLRSLLVTLGTIDVAVMEEVRDFSRLHDAVMRHLPDVVLIDLPLEGLDGPPQLLELRHAQPELAFAALVQPDTDMRSLRKLAASAAVALLTTEATQSDVAEALCLVTAGFTVVCRQLVKSIFQETGHDLGRPALDSPALAERERAILQALARGQSESNIARSLSLSTRTVQTYIARARHKLQAVDRTHAVALALAAGLIQPPWGITAGGAGEGPPESSQAAESVPSDSG